MSRYKNGLVLVYMLEIYLTYHIIVPYNLRSDDYGKLIEPGS